MLKSLYFMTAILVIGGLYLSGADAAGPMAEYALTVSFDLKNSLVKGSATVSLPEGAWAELNTSGLRVLAVSVNGKETEHKDGSKIKIPKGGTAEVVYEGTFGDGGGGGGGVDPKNPGVAKRGYIGPKGIYLTDGWHPTLEGAAIYRLTALVPKGMTAISEAEEITFRELGGHDEYAFRFQYPLSGLSIIAGPYEVTSGTAGDTEVYGYFFGEDSALANRYVTNAIRFIEMYKDLLGPFPYRRFSVVENLLPTGYSLPTFTLLGQSVVRLPFIADASLGHEIVHQWFGNYVFSDFEKGNWIEALTTYLSNHYFREKAGEGWQYRKDMLVSYQSYAGGGEKDFPLREFKVRTDFATRAVGYDKGAMVFHMLNKLVGEDAFYEALKSLIDTKKFTVATWEDLKGAFEKVSVEDLDGFFNSWLTRTGSLSFKIEEPRVVLLGGEPTVSFRVRQSGPPYGFTLPLKIETGSESIRRTVTVRKDKEFFEIPLPPGSGDPVRVIFDEDYDLLRELPAAERPPVISTLIGADKRLLVVPEGEREKYRALIEILEDDGFKVMDEGDFKGGELRDHSVILLGNDTKTVKRLFGGPVEITGVANATGVANTTGVADATGVANATGVAVGGFGLRALKNPFNPSQVVVVAVAVGEDEVEAAARKVYRYGKYSRIAFKKGRNVLKRTDASARGMEVSLGWPAVGIEPRRTLTLQEIIVRVSDKAVIYVGESHTNYEDHKVQLEVIRGLHARGIEFAVGMEMFQRPFQEALDGYVSGEHSEGEFLIESEYFSRWSVNYHQYREIIDFARTKGIPLVALNMDRDIVVKVSKGGLAALSDEELARLPAQMDMSDEKYRERLRDIYFKHKGAREEGFSNFHLAQIVWDETMAQTVDEYMKKNPGSRMVVIAGMGHLMYGSGIPKRAHRLNGKDYAIIISAKIDALDPDVADYVIFTRPQSAPRFQMLMVFLAKEDGGMRVTGFPPGSISKDAGIRKGDVILSIDGDEIASVADLKVSLLDKKEGQHIKVLVLRKRLIFRDLELEFELTL